MKRTARRFRIRLISVAIIGVMAVVGCAERDPAAAMRAFYINDGAEDTLMDPLILAGDEVVPLVLDAVIARDMPRRRYAVSFLGNGGFREALPTLERLLADETEDIYVRVSCLIAIYQIDARTGRQRANALANREDSLGHTASDVLEHKPHIDRRRTYLQALFRRHD